MSLSDLTVPGPTSIPLTEPFWTSAAEGRLCIQRCRACGTYVFYPRNRCTACWSADLEWVVVSGGARLLSFSEVWKPGHPGWIPAAPYLVAIVQLSEGPTLLTHIVGGSRPLSIGDALQFSPTNIGGRLLPCFAISEND